MVLHTKKASKNKLERLCSQCILPFLNHIVKVEEDYTSQNLHMFFKFGLIDEKGNLTNAGAWFILGFLGMSIVASIFSIPTTVVSGTKTISKFLMVCALSAIGLNYFCYIISC